MHAGFEFDPNNIPMEVILGNTTGGLAIPMAFDPAPLDISPITLRQPNDRTWVEQWGYGIVNQPDGEQSAAGNLDSGTQFFEAAEPTAEGAAFTLAFMGDPDDTRICEVVGAMTHCRTREDMTWEQRNELSGCTGWALNQQLAETPASLQASDEFAPLFTAINQMRNDFQLSVTDADIDWAACMAEAGFNRVQRQADAQVQVSDALFALLNSANFDDTSPAWVALAEHERNIALADLDCRNATDFTARRQAEQIAVETQFVNDNRAALEALRAAAEQIGS